MTIAELIRSTNAEYDAASIERKRVMVAQDVLKLIEQPKLAATHSCYLNIRDWDEDGNSIEWDEEPFTDDINCCVCAVGAEMMASSLRKGANTRDLICLSGNEFDRPESPFTIAMLEIIEALYEETDTAFRSYYTTQGIKDLRTQLEGVSDDKGRMRLIYQHIIDTQGEDFTHFKGDN